MGAYARLYLFSGSDTEYIHLLEKALQVLQSHHLNCRLGSFSTSTQSNRPPKRRRDGTPVKPPAVLGSAAPTSCLALPPSGTLLPSTPPDGARSTPSLTAPSAPAASHPPQGGSQNPSKKARAGSWKKAADALITDTPVAESWTTPWIVDSGVFSDCHSTAELILGTSFPKTISGVAETGFQDEILVRAAAFASNIANYGNRADLYTKIHSFYELVLGSLCIVLLDCGKPQEDVDSIMQIHISNAEPKHLNRLRNGAKWANSLVNALHWRGWGKRAQELLFYWGKPITLYGRFSDSRSTSLPYFVTRLSEAKYINGPTTGMVQDSLTAQNPLIPSLVRSVIGTSVAEERICEVLGYTNTAPSPLAYNHRQLPGATQGPARVRNAPGNGSSRHAHRPTESNAVQQIQLEDNGLGSLTPDPSLVSFAGHGYHQTVPSASLVAHWSSPASVYQPFNYASHQSTLSMNSFDVLGTNDNHGCSPIAGAYLHPHRYLYDDFLVCLPKDVAVWEVPNLGCTSRADL